MSLEQGLNVIKNNYDVDSVSKDGATTTVTTKQTMQLAEILDLIRLGWEVLSNTVAKFVSKEPVVVKAELPLETPPDQPDSTENE